MYTGSHCVALGHDLVALWFLDLHCGLGAPYIGRGGGGEKAPVLTLPFSV